MLPNKLAYNSTLLSKNNPTRPAINNVGSGWFPSRDLSSGGSSNPGSPMLSACNTHSLTSITQQLSSSYTKLNALVSPTLQIPAKTPPSKRIKLLNPWNIVLVNYVSWFKGMHRHKQGSVGPVFFFNTIITTPPPSTLTSSISRIQLPHTYISFHPWGSQPLVPTPLDTPATWCRS